MNKVFCFGSGWNFNSEKIKERLTINIENELGITVKHTIKTLAGLSEDVVPKLFSVIYDGYLYKKIAKLECKNGLACLKKTFAF